MLLFAKRKRPGGIAAPRPVMLFFKIELLFLPETFTCHGQLEDCYSSTELLRRNLKDQNVYLTINTHLDLWRRRRGSNPRRQFNNCRNKDVF